MEYTHLSETVKIKTVEEKGQIGVFEIGGLYAGYGLTMGNALRRTLLSSLPGAAVTYLKIKNAPHEFSTLPGVKEDIVEMVLNFKQLRFEVETHEPQVLLLNVKGEKKVTASDIESNAEVRVANPDLHLATLTEKKAELSMEITVERGLGYSSVESRKSEKLPIGTIGIDALFSPVKSVNYSVENMRVGDRTDYNRLTLTIETDGTISPSAALRKGSKILRDHFEKASELEVKETKKSSTEKKSKK